MKRIDYEKYSYVRSFNFLYLSVTDGMVADIHSHGIKVKIWTVKGPEDTPQIDVDGVITNYPQLWRR